MDTTTLTAATITDEQIRNLCVRADLVRPNVALLAEFCTNVTFKDEEQEPLTDNTGCDV